MNVFTSKHESIVLTESPFASGGEGAVYKVISAPEHLHDTCVKIYHKHILNENRERRIKYMVANPPSKIRDDGFLLGWPLEYVTDEYGKFLGFIMPLGFPESKELVNLTATSLSKKLDKKWQDRYNRSLGKTALLSRLKLICNIAIPAHILHSTGKYVLKDFKPQNVLATADGRITIVDMDSIQIAEDNNLLFPGTAATIDYVPPEFYSKGIGKKADDIIKPSWDTFAMGVVFYQLLFGIHPYVVTPKLNQDDGSNDISHNISSGLFPFGENGDMVKVRPKLHDNFMKLPSNLQELFVRTFTEVEESRPTAKDWGILVKQLVFEGESRDNTKWKSLYESSQNEIAKLNSEINDLTSVIDTYRNQPPPKKSWFNLASYLLMGLSGLLLAVILFMHQNSRELERRIYYLNNKIENNESESAQTIQKKTDEINQLNEQLASLKKDISSVAPFVIYKVEIANVYSGGEIQTDYGNTLHSAETMYLKPKIYYKGFSAGDYNLCIKWYLPNGNLSQGSSSPYGYSQESKYSFSEGDNYIKLDGWGGSDKGSWSGGDHRLEIWYDDKCVFMRKFYIYYGSD